MVAGVITGNEYNFFFRSKQIVKYTFKTGTESFFFFLKHLQWPSHTTHEKCLDHFLKKIVCLKLSYKYVYACDSNRSLLEDKKDQLAIY